MTFLVSAGTKLDRYETRSQIGAGRVGEVDTAQDTNLNPKVAPKNSSAVSRNHFLNDSDWRASDFEHGQLHVTAGGVSPGRLAVCLATICQWPLRFIHTLVMHNSRLISFCSNVAQAVMR